MSINRISALVALLFLSFYLPPAHAADRDGSSYLEIQDGPTIAVDWSMGNIQSVTLGGNRTLTFSNGQKGRKYALVIKQDAAGSRTVTWPASVRWPGGAPQTAGQPVSVLTTTANKTDYITFFYNGVNYDVLSLSQNY
jgi:hypothetical protein